MEPGDKHSGAKALLISCGVLAGLVVFFSLAVDWSSSSLAFRRPRNLVFIGIVSITSMYGYVWFAAEMSKTILRIRDWAYVGKATKLSDGQVLVIGALWPVFFVFGSIVYLFLGIIHRNF